MTVSEEGWKARSASVRSAIIVAGVFSAYFGVRVAMVLMDSAANSKNALFLPSFIALGALSIYVFVIARKSSRVDKTCFALLAEGASSIDDILAQTDLSRDDVTKSVKRMIGDGIVQGMYMDSSDAMKEGNEPPPEPEVQPVKLEQATCPRCGAIYDKDTGVPDFCEYCGTRLQP